MTRLSWQENSVILTHGITILSNNPISYPYFCERFSHTIDFFNKATLTYNYDDEPDGGNRLYSYYSSFLRDYTGLFSLQEESNYLKKDGNNVTISLIVVMLDHLKWKMKVNTDLLKPLEQYDEESMNEYISKYFENQKTLYDVNLKNLLFSVEEVFNFKREGTKTILQKLSESSNGNDMVTLILDGIRYDKGHPEEREITKDLLLGINPDNVILEKKVESNQILAYYLFNLIFLEKPYFLFRAGELIKYGENMYSDWILVDRFTLNQIRDCGNSGLTIQSSLPFNMFNTYMDDQETFQTIKKDIANEYAKLFQETNSQKEIGEKVAKFIEETIANYPKTAFYIGTKNKAISFVDSIVTEADKKKYYEVQQKLGTQTYENQDGRRIFTKRTKIEDIEK